MTWPVHSQIQVSRWQQVAHALGFVSAILAVWWAILPLMIHIGLTVILMISAWLYRQSRHAAQQIAYLSLEDEQWSIILQSGQRLRVELRDYGLWRWLIWLRLHGKDSRSRYHVVLWPDSINGHDFRRLQVWLRWSSR